jgi:protoporphyrinogen oxidase
VTHLIILGAGPAGLGAAFAASRTGHRVTILERAGRVGGASASFELAGMRVDLGSHRLHPSIEPRILADLQALLGNSLQKRERNGRIRLLDRWMGFPLKAADVVTRTPKGFAARAMRDAVVSPFRRPRTDTFAEVLRAGLGPTISDTFYLPYARKIWGIDPGRLSGEQARRRVTADSFVKLAGRVLRGSGSGGARGSSYFWYPERGYGAISEALAAGASENGADVRLGERVTTVTILPDSVAVTTGTGQRIEGDFLFSTVPLPVLAGLTGADETTMASARGLRIRSMVLVYLVLDAARFSTFDAHYFPEEGTPVTRISEPKNYRDASDPENKTILCAEIPCWFEDETWSGTPDSLGETVTRTLHDAGLKVPPIESVHVERLRAAYPVYEVGFERHLEVVDAWVSNMPRAITFGRQGLFAHDNAHHALAMAYTAVDLLGPAGTFDAVGWEAAKTRFARHVVED